MTVLAQNALATLDDAKIALGIDPSDEDAQRDAAIATIINGASAGVERLTGRNLRRQGYVQRFDANGGQELVLPQWPILAVEYIRDTRANREIPPEEYDWGQTGGIGVIFNDRGWPHRGWRGGLANDITAPMRAIEVAYTAGYVLPNDATPEDPCTLPADLQMVVRGIVAQEWSTIRNGAAGLSAFSISDVSWTFDKEPRQDWLDTIGYYTRL
jgi:hypothetical protein